MSFATIEDAERVLDHSGWTIYKGFIRPPMFFETDLYEKEEQMDAMQYLVGEWGYSVDMKGQ